MPQTVLRGPNGGPAIDNMTGTPLTMEEMLRRNGIVATGNTVSMMGPQSDPNAAAQPSAAPTPTSGPGVGVRAAMSQRSGGGGGVDPASNPAPATAPPGATDGPAADPALDALAQNNTDPNVVAMLEKAGLVAAGTAAAYGVYRLAKRMGGGSGGATVAGDPNYVSRPVEDGQFRDIYDPALEGPNKKLPAPRKQIGDSTRKALSGRGNVAAQIEGPRNALPNNGRTATAQALAARAARGGPTDVGTIHGTPPVRTISEPADAGVARTLGLPQQVLKMLKTNPGILRTLSRVP